MGKKQGTLEEQEHRARFTLIRSMLRRAWSRDPERYATLASARRVYIGANKRQKWEYECAICKEWCIQKNVQVDHLVPCGTFLCDLDWHTFCSRLFCKRNHLRVLCKQCHAIVTQEERRAKRANL